MTILPRYPIYVPSKGRFEICYTAQFLIEDGVPFYLVVEPQEAEAYGARFGAHRLLVLPWSNLGIGGLIAARNWIKEHAIAVGHIRHWQLDDNIKGTMRVYRGKRIPCSSQIALAATEDFVDRYENVAIAGLNYSMFVGLQPHREPPFLINCRVYSCSLILNSLPHRWRLAYNDDTDICLQVLADGWCTILMQAFVIQKMQTMIVRGGNTPIYQADGRLKMARSLERMWPGVVQTKRRFHRPQHVVKDAWRRFDTPLRLKPGVNLADLPLTNEYGMKLMQIKPIKSKTLDKLIKENYNPER